MILVDTSVWIDHLHRPVDALVEMLEGSLVAEHPMVVGELALGSLRDRDRFLALLMRLPRLPTAEGGELVRFVEVNSLHGRGLSLVDAHLLASTRLAPGARLWTRDKRLSAAADQLGIAYRPDSEESR